MKKWKKMLAIISCIALIVSTFASTGVSAVVGAGEQSSQTGGSSSKATAYEKIKTSKITGEGGDPAEISGSASALSAEKKWYEYITYSSEPVGYYPIDSKTRIVFYDPYDYSNALIMQVDGSISNWSSANSITATYTTGNSMDTGYSSSNSTDTSVEVQQGRDESYGFTSGKSSSATDDWSNNFNAEATIGATLSGTVGAEAGGDIGGVVAKAYASVTASVEVSATVGVGSSTGGTLSQEGSEETTNGWSTVADRLTTTLGSSSSVNKNWSANDSTTISSTYNAAYFNSQGAPLQWKIIEYSVKMPMYYEIQYKIDNEWFTVHSAYCILTTVQGTCRSWLNNNVAYYEHWGTGEPVTWSGFWSGFFTTDSLVAAYKDKLYPDN